MTPQLPHDSVVPPDAAELPAESGAVEDTPQPPASDATAEPPTSEAPAATDEAEELSQAELEQLIDEYSGEAAPTTGEIRQSTVVKVTSDGIVVDLGMKSEGVVPLGEFTDEEENITAQPGDSIEVLVEASQARDGYIPCSSEGAHRLKLWEQVERAHREQEKVRCRATRRVRGGLEVEINLPGAHARRRPLTAFMPGSQVDLRPVRHWEGFLSRTLTARVIRLNRHRGNVVVSRRVLLEKEQVQRKKLLEEVIKEGAELKGTVKNLTDYGAFVDLGAWTACCTLPNISYRRLTHPSEALASGQELTFKVLKVEKKKGRISLGLKQLEPDPWTGVAAKYRTGERVRGRVTHLLDYGAFVEVEPGLEGLIHVSEMSWTRRVRHPSEVLNEGDWVEAAILDVQPAEKRLSLGLRQTEPDPFQAIAAKFPPGSVVEGTVKSLTDFGAFIELEPGVEGLVHLSELSWKKKLKKPSEVLKRGQPVQAKVLRGGRAQPALEPEPERPDARPLGHLRQPRPRGQVRPRPRYSPRRLRRVRGAGRGGGRFVPHLRIAHRRGRGQGRGGVRVQSYQVEPQRAPDRVEPESDGAGNGAARPEGIPRRPAALHRHLAGDSGVERVQLRDGKILRVLASGAIMPPRWQPEKAVGFLPSVEGETTLV